MPFISNIGPGELIIVAVIVLLIFGPGRLPDVGQALGKGIREFRKAATDVTEATRLEPTPTTTATHAPQTAAAEASTPPASAGVPSTAPAAAPAPAPAPAPGPDADRDSTVA